MPPANLTRGPTEAGSPQRLRAPADRIVSYQDRAVAGCPCWYPIFLYGPWRRGLHRSGSVSANHRRQPSPGSAVLLTIGGPSVPRECSQL